MPTFKTVLLLLKQVKGQRGVKMFVYREGGFRDAGI